MFFLNILKDVMGTFRFGLILAGILTFSATAQDAVPVNPQPQPADPNAPGLPVPAAPDLTLPAPAPEVAIPAETGTNAPAAHSKKASKASKDGKKEGKKADAPKNPTLRGTVNSINTTNMTVTVEVKGKEEVVKVTSQTRVFADAKPAILGDAKQGEKVVIEYKTGKDKSKEATALRFGSLTAKKETPQKETPLKEKE